MLNETFYIDGVDARNFGIYLQKPIEFSEAVPIVERQSIPGRNGDLIFETGAYENRTATASCFCLQKDVGKALSAASKFLMSKHGYRRLETSDDPDHFWLARVENSPQIAKRLNTLAPFEITFDCKPQRFLKSGEDPIKIDFVFGQIVWQVFNEFGFSSRPLIHARWKTDTNNSISLRIVHGDNSEGIDMENLDGQDAYIDCDTHNVYNDFGNQNKRIHTYEFPALAPGNNYVNIFAFDTLEYIEITPRWWEL